MSTLRLLPPPTLLRGRIRLGGSKSISNRVLILKAVTDSIVTVTNLSDAEDSMVLQDILQQIQNSKKANIDVHHAGTNLRFLCAYLSTLEGDWLLTGSARLCERPVSGLVNALKELGAEIHYADKPEHPPLRIHGKQLKGGKVKLKADISSQYVSALILSAPRFEFGLEIELLGKKVSYPYVLMSAELLRAFGYPVLIESQTISIKIPETSPKFSGTYAVESDWSSASYWYSICALSSGSSIELEGLQEKSLQADSVTPVLFEKLGVKSRFKEGRLVLENTSSFEKEFEFDFSDCPDIALTLACTCLGLGVQARLLGLKTLQIKESRRIDALKTELIKFGAAVDAGEDHLFITPPQLFPSAIPEIKTYQDHRMAMAFASLSIRFPGIIIHEPEVVKKSYPRFWRDLQSLGFSLNLQT